MTLVILTAGIDLSVGSTLALATSVTGLCLTTWAPAIGTSGKILFAISCALAASALVGSIEWIRRSRICASSLSS